MLKIEANKGQTSIGVEGTLADICADTARAISGIYDALRKSDPDAATMYRRCVTALVTHPDSPLWTACSDESVLIDMSHVKRGEG